METQTQVEMENREIHPERPKEPMEDITEEQFLKNLYLFMKKRDTPIERIPNLGFKQIDLFVMFKVVRELGGYHQVTAQQLWKQVYNTLGGNPRSTSAATCTRRHYEKLLLPYECHLTGVMVNVLPHNQPKHFVHCMKEHDDGQRPAKYKKLLHMPPHNLQPDLHERVFPLPPHYPHYYHPTQAVLPPHIPMSPSVLTPHTPPAPKLWFPFPPSGPSPSDRVKEPLKQLRELAEDYMNTSRLSEPLNLSIKAQRQETNSNPASSFTPPSSSKNPKFLNRPSPLYTTRRLQVVTPDGEEGSGETPYSYPLRTDEGAPAKARKPSSPGRDLTIQESACRERSLEVRELNLSQLLPSIPREDGGKMEIEMPLSVFHNWLSLYRSSATMHGAKQQPSFPPQEECRAQRHSPDTDALSFHQHRSPGADDVRLLQKNLPSPMLPGHPHQNHFSTYKPLPSGGILKNTVSQDVYPFDISNPYMSKPHNCWDMYSKESPPVPMTTDSSPHSAQQHLAASTSYSKDAVQAGRDKSNLSPSAVLMLNSSATSLLHLTNEEVMKLKKIISSS